MDVSLPCSMTFALNRRLKAMHNIRIPENENIFRAVITVCLQKQEGEMEGG